MYVTKAQLSSHELPRLLKLMVDHAYENPQVIWVDDLIGAVAGKFGLALTEEHRGQVYSAVSLVVSMPKGAVPDAVVGAELDRAISSFRRRNPLAPTVHGPCRDIARGSEGSADLGLNALRAGAGSPRRLFTLAT